MGTTVPSPQRPTGRTDPNGLQPVRRRSVSEVVYEQLRDQILTGQLAPGQSLPGERKLSEMLSTNRGGVREALKRLVQAGLVVTRHGGSTRVLDYRRSGTLDLLQQVLLREDGTLDPSVGRSLLDFRRVVLAELARLAAERGRRDACARARARLQEARACADEPERLRQLSWEFWEILADAADSLAFRLALNTLRGVYLQVDASLESLPHACTVEDLESILAAVERGDGHASRLLTEERFERAEQTLRKPPAVSATVAASQSA